MKELSVEVPIYSPRWARSDDYIISFTKNGLRITTGSPKVATCTFPGGSDPSKDPVWDGHGGTFDGNNPLLLMWQDDYIYAPQIVCTALEEAWRRWKSDKTTEDQLREGIKEVFSWVDLIAKNTPRGEFWYGVLLDATVPAMEKLASTIANEPGQRTDGRALWDLAKEYHERTEAYDRTVCTGPIGRDGGIMPANGRESGLINRNAAAVRKEIAARAVEMGFTLDKLQEAIVNYRPEN
ncbi:MAG TPA: hypothetical protein VG122_06030 [Gemmata sp.]|nr:hypothetical protein [Gemmata sp.]